MNYGLYLSAMGAQVQMERQAVVTNNLANAQTTGFKRDLVIQQARLSAAYEDPKMAAYRLPGLNNQGGGVFNINGGIDLSQGTLKDSGNPLDIALNGRGFFTVQGDKGTTLLTRDGHFDRDQDGQLLSSGRPVLDKDGNPITLSLNGDVTIAKNGNIAQGGIDTGVSLGIVNVADSQQLIKMGANRLRAVDGANLAQAPADTQVMQYKLEESGVNEMTEIVNMIEGQRAFEANAKMISYQDQTMSLLNTVGRIA
jgi:flagellar basal-body rod protein FlgF